MPGTSISRMEPSPISQPPGKAEQTSSAPGKLPKAVEGQAHFAWADSACSGFPGGYAPLIPVQMRFAAQSTGAMI